MQEGELSGGVRDLYYVMERDDGAAAEMSVIVRGDEIDHVLLTTPLGSYLFRGNSAEMFLEFVEKELLGTRLVERCDQAAGAEAAEDGSEG
jgi:hypothetical protein